MNLERKRGKGPKKWCLDAVLSNTRTTGMCMDVLRNREQRYRTKETDPNSR